MLYAFLTNTIIINHHMRRQMDYNDNQNPHALKKKKRKPSEEKKFRFCFTSSGEIKKAR